MSTSLFDELNELVSDDASKVEYKHELALSAFTNNLARLMAAKGMSQSDLARQLGISRARVSQLMKHASSPTLRTMVQLSDAFDCDFTPAMTPCGFRVVHLSVADGGKAVASYTQARQISTALKGRAVTADRIAS